MRIWLLPQVVQKSSIFLSYIFGRKDKYTTFATAFRRDGRVVECGGLENRCPSRDRGFESLSLRKETKGAQKSVPFFCYYPF